MNRVDDRTAANLDVVLEHACKALPHGGDHSFRKKIAKKLLSAVHRGNTTLGRLSKIARQAAADAAKRRPT